MSYTWGGGGEGSYFYRGREGAKARKGRRGAACLKSEIAGRRQVIDYWRCARLFSIRRQFYLGRAESDGVCDPPFPLVSRSLIKGRN